MNKRHSLTRSNSRGPIDTNIKSVKVSNSGKKVRSLTTRQSQELGKTGKSALLIDKYVAQAKEETSDLPSGAVKIAYKGGVYEGEVISEMPNGKGTWEGRDSSKYVGQWCDGLPHGQGTYIQPASGESVGDDLNLDIRPGTADFENLMPDDASTFKYIGDWIHGRTKGRGTLTMPDGTVYEGDFDDGPDGEGIRMHVNGEIYSGNFYCGFWNGGIVRLPNGEYLQDCEKGTIRWDGGTYVGGLKKAMSEGFGVWKVSEDEKYIGEWVDGERKGWAYLLGPEPKSEGFIGVKSKGTYEYFGEVWSGEPHMKGVLVRPDGEIELGFFKDGGLWNGFETIQGRTAIMHYVDGEISTGPFEIPTKMFHSTEGSVVGLIDDIRSSSHDASDSKSWSAVKKQIESLVDRAMNLVLESIDDIHQITID